MMAEPTIQIQPPIYITLNPADEGYQTQLEIERVWHAREALRRAVDAESRRLESIRGTTPAKRESATQRRRDFRRLRSASKNRSTDPLYGPRGRLIPADDNRRRNAAWALRMLERHIEPDKVRLIHRDYRFWLGRAAGWNFDDPQFWFDQYDRPCEAVACESFVWWCELPPQQRMMMVRDNRSDRYVSAKFA